MKTAISYISNYTNIRAIMTENEFDELFAQSVTLLPGLTVSLFI